MTFHRGWASALLCGLAVFLSSSLHAREIKSFAFYYGAGKIKELSQYDLVVIQPYQYTAEDISKIKKNGTLVLGYISLGEDDKLRRDNGKGPGGHAPWYVDQFTGPGFKTIGADKAPDMNEEWNSYYVDPSNSHWAKLIQNNVLSLRKDLGLDGVFADTVLIPRDVFTIDVEKRMDKGMNNLVSKLKTWTEGGFVLVNNGHLNAKEWAPRVDGIILESTYDPTSDLPAEFAKIFSEIKTASGSHTLFVGGLIYIPPSENISKVCLSLAGIGFPNALIKADEDGRMLKSLPSQTCR